MKEIKKLFLLFICSAVFCAAISAQEASSEIEKESSTENNTESSINMGENEKPVKDFQNHIVPMLGFQTLQIAEKDFILSPSATLQFVRTKTPGVKSAQPDSIGIAANYGQSIFTKGIEPDDVKLFHSVSFMGSVGFGKNSITMMLANGGQVLFDDITAITGGLIYSRQFIKNSAFSLNLGAGIIVADLGIKIGNYMIYAMPLPVFSFAYTSKYFYGSCSFMGTPSLSMVLFPQAMFRLKCSCEMTGFSSIRDLGFDCAIAYYPLKNTSAGDFLSISAGVMNKKTSFKLKNKDKHAWQYYCAYGEINASIISLRAGYNFDGKAYKNNEIVSDLQKGLFASIQAMYMF